jgi:LPXTG-site transpeptidase (sortase) family protein
MLNSRWMILIGILLLAAGLANAFYEGVRQPEADLDIEVGSAGGLSQGFAPMDVPELSSDTGKAPTVAATPQGAPGSVTETPAAATATPTPFPGLPPERIVIPAIDLDAPIEPAKTRLIQYYGKLYEQWVAPNGFAAGWHGNSSMVGVAGNTVLNGHHNVNGEVFGRLVELEEGDIIEVYSGNELFVYEVRLKMILKELGEPIEVRYQNARWILPSLDERLTLVTCWPKTGNTHRLIIVAFPTDLVDVPADLEEH